MRCHFQLSGVFELSGSLRELLRDLYAFVYSMSIRLGCQTVLTGLVDVVWRELACGPP